MLRYEPLYELQPSDEASQFFDLFFWRHFQYGPDFDWVYFNPSSLTDDETKSLPRRKTKQTDWGSQLRFS